VTPDGLHVEKFPQDESKLFVMAATPTRHYQFIGGPSFEALFAKYTANPLPSRFVELPGDLGYSELRYSHQPTNHALAVATAAAAAAAAAAKL